MIIIIIIVIIIINTISINFIIIVCWLPTVSSLAAIFRSHTTTRFSEPIKRQSHTARLRQIKSNEYSVLFLGIDVYLSIYLYLAWSNEKITRHSAWPGPLWKYFMTVSCIWWDHWVWLCISEAVCL